MKLLVRFFLVISLFLTINSYSQSISLGSGTNVNGTQESSPVNIWYRRCVNQTVYTVAELNSAGITGPATIRQLAYYVTQAPVYDIPGYQISMKHTTANNAGGNLEGGYTVVKNAFTYSPTAGGWDFLNLDTPFNWNGTQNIVVRVCWTQVQPTYNASGQCRIYNSANGYKYRWDDNAGGACGLVPNTTNNNKPQINFIFDTVSVWTGALNSNWNVAGNWTKGVPNQYIDAKIPAGTANNPNVNTSVSCEELILQGTMSLAAGGTLNIYGHFTNTGTFTDNGGITKLVGKTSSNISGNTTFSNLRIETSGGSAVTSGTITINKELQVNKSTFNTNNAVILKSDATGTARIAELKTACVYTLTMNDSYGDGWNGGYLTVFENGVSIGTFSAQGFGSVETFTVASGSTISMTYTSGSWENENSVTLTNPYGAVIFSDNAPIATGTIHSSVADSPFNDLITGTISMERYIDAGETYWRNFSSAVENATIGMYLDDFVTAGFPGSPWPAFPFNSIYTYDESLGAGDGWVGCTGTSQIIGTGQGLYVWSGDTITGTDPFTLDLVGNPNQGPINLPVTYTNTGTINEDGWNLVGNPYASTIDWDSPNWTKTNMADAIYIQDPDNQQYAAYVSGAGTNGGSRYIPSQQSFWVYANAASPLLTLRESCKSSVDQAFFKNGTYSPGMSIKISGFGYSDESVLRHIDGTSEGLEVSFDAPERWGGWGVVPQLSLVNSIEEDYTIHSMEIGSQELVVPMRAIVFETGSYNLTFTNISELNVPCLKLEDTYTGIFYDISEGTSLSFVLSDTTWNARFMLHTGKNYPAEITAATCFNGADGSFEINLDNPSNVDYTLTLNGNSMSGNGAGNPLLLQDLMAGDYMLEIPSLVNSCSQTAFLFSVLQPDPISTSADITDEIEGADGSITVTITGGTQPYTTSWNNGSFDAQISNLEEGEYVLTVTDANNCLLESTFYVGTSVGLTEDMDEIKFIYFPEFNQIRIIGAPDSQISMYNINGELIMFYTVNPEVEITLDIPAHLASGVYILNCGHGVEFKFAKN